MNRKLIVLVIILISNHFSYSQNLTPIWTSIYQGQGDNSDRFNKIISDGQGNFIAVGYTIKPNNYRDFLTVKFDSNGDTLWWRTKNGSANENDEAISACVDLAGNVFVTGYRGDDETQDDILIVKYDNTGNNLWDTTWNSPASLDDVPVEILADINGDIYVGGIAEPDSFMGSSDFITLKYSTNGALLWQQQFSRQSVVGGKDEIRGMVLGLNNDLCVTGRSESQNDDDFVTICYNTTNGAELWYQIYNGGNGNDRANCITSDPFGNFIVAGRNHNGQNQDFRIIKYNSSGSIIWIKFYNAPSGNDDEALAIASDNAGNVYVTGTTVASGNFQHDIAVVKFNSAGIGQWSRIIYSTALQDDVPSDITVDASGNVYITGKSDQDNGLSTNNDFITAMFNTSGDLQWQKFHSGSRFEGSDISSSICLDNAGNILVAGGSEYNSSQKDATVVKYDHLGNVIWERNWNGTGDNSETAKSIVVDAQGNAFVGGYAFRYEHDRDATIVKTDVAGNIICSFEYNGTNSEDDELNEIAFDHQGNIIAAGFTKSLDQKSDFLVMKFSAASCDTLWVRKYDFVKQSDRAESVVCDATGNVYVTGRSDSDILDTIENNDIVTIKYDQIGNQVWLQRHNGSGNMRDEATKILIDNSSNVIVTGRSENQHDDDFVVLKYDSQTGNPVWPIPVFYNGPFSNDDRPLDMAIDAADNIFVCGYSQTGSVPAPDDAVVIKVSATGSLLESYNYDGPGGTGNDQAVKLACDVSGNVFVSFVTDVNPVVNIIDYDILTVKLDNNLFPLWIAPPHYSSPVYKDDIPSGIETDDFGNVFVIGSTEDDTSGGSTNRNWIILRYDHYGNQIMSGMVDGSNQTDDSPNALFIQGSSLWVCGFLENSNNHLKDIAIQRYELSVGVSDLAFENQSTVFPNPFTSQAEIKLINAPDVELNLEIFNNHGALVRIQKITNAGYIPLHRDKLNAGIYQYVISDNIGWSQQGRFIIQY